MQPGSVRDADVPPPLVDPDEAAREDEDVIPTLWRRGRRQTAFLVGLAFFGAALACGTLNWVGGPTEVLGFSFLSLVVAALCWAGSKNYHGPIFANVELGRTRVPGRVRVKWRLGDDGRIPSGDGEVRFEGRDLVTVHTEQVTWDLLVIVGIAGTVAALAPGRMGLAFPELRAIAFILGVAALHTFGLPRRRRVEALVALDDITRVDLRGARYFVTYRGGHEPLIFDAGQLARMRLNEQFDRLMRERFHIDAHLRPGQVVPRREPSLDDLDETAARLVALRNGDRPAR